MTMNRSNLLMDKQLLLLALVIIIMTFNYSTRTCYADKSCVLSALISNQSALCDRVINAQSKTSKLENCQLISEVRQVTESGCDQLLAQDGICDLIIDIHHLTSYVPFTKTIQICNEKGTPIEYNLILNQTKPIDGTQASIFEIADLSVKSIHFVHIKFTTSPILFIKKNFQVLKHITFTNSESEFYISPGLNEEQYLETFTAIDSFFKGIHQKSFELSGRFTSINLSGVTLSSHLGSPIEAPIFIISESNCQSQKLQVNLQNMALKEDYFSDEIIQYQPSTSCSNIQIQLDFSMTGQSFEKILPKMFSNFLNTTLQSNKLAVNFTFDEIDCCLKDNRWLFDLLMDSNFNATENRARSNLNIGCFELGTTVNSYKNMVLLEEVCYNRHIYPILIIAIIAILLLAVLISIFSFICIFYVLPKRNQEILMNAYASAGKNSSIQGSSAKSSDILELDSAQMTGTKTAPSIPRLTLIGQPDQTKHQIGKKQAAKTKSQEVSARTVRLPIVLPFPDDSPSRDQAGIKRKYSASNLPKKGTPIDLVELNLPRNVYSLPGYRNRGSKQGYGKKHKSPHKHQPQKGVAKKLHAKTFSSTYREARERGRRKSSPESFPIGKVVVLDNKKSQETFKTLESRPVKPKALDKKVKSPKIRSAEKVLAPLPIVATKAEKSLDEQMSLAFKTIN